MIRRIAAFELVTPDVDRLAEFYCRHLGFARHGHALRLGAQEVRLAPAGAGARPYPSGSTASDLWFQHFAIVTTDIAAAVALAEAAGAVAITAGGPQHLPLRSGGVIAWKFRDPDGHPLELLQFPPGAMPAAWRGARGLHVGIDHSAISIAEIDASIAYYRERFGFVPISRELNWGAEQALLDGMAGARAEIVGLRIPEGGPPHLELLGYDPPGRPSTVGAGDIAATCIVLETDGGPPAGSAPDPDGHWTRWEQPQPP